MKPEKHSPLPPTIRHLSLSLSGIGSSDPQRRKMMHMTFYWGTHVTLLVDAWKTTSLAGYSLTLFTCFLFSVFYQYLEDRRIRFKHVTSAEASSGIAASLLYKKLAGGCSTARLAGAALFGVNAAIGYLLMLSVMSYNGGVFVAVVIGLAVGYLIFRNGDEDVVVFDNPCPCA